MAAADDGVNSTTQKLIEVPFSPKAPIKCSLKANHSTAGPAHPSLIFTHGSGGTIESPAIADLSDGFAAQASILCFQGNMNLGSRVKMFARVCDEFGFSSCLGGRSMGARAAVMTSTGLDTGKLVLVSYPLQSGSKLRDQLLLDIPASTKVIFAIGEKDQMCDLQRLKEVRDRMKCPTWLVTVRGADHGMTVRPRIGTRDMGLLTGQVVAEWLKSTDETGKDAVMWWDPAKEKAEWSGWTSIESNGRRPMGTPSTATASDQLPAKSTKKRDLEDAGPETTSTKASKRARRTRH